MQKFKDVLTIITLLLVDGYFIFNLANYLVDLIKSR
ncbi:MAG: hypothetical protein Ta2C_10870 [Candidatus Endomicrobiellum trichonymphae]|nr:MAG: hypothetical protein Ta2C_10870 [Candidatus Endomicrobium trichonymphae]